MKLYNTFKDVYVGELTVSDHEELAKFASALIRSKKARNALQVSALLKEAASRIHDVTDFDRIVGLCGYLNKTAEAKKFNWDKASDYVLKGGVVLSATAPLLAAAALALRKHMKHEDSFRTILKEHPSLGGPNTPVTRRHFDTLKTFSPDIAANSLVAGNVLHRLHRLGPEGMDVAQVRELASVQSQLRDGNLGAGNVLRNVGDITKTVGEMLRPVDTAAKDLEVLEQTNRTMRAGNEYRLLTDPNADRTARVEGEVKALRAQLMLKQLQETASRNEPVPSKGPAYLGLESYQKRERR